MTSKDCPYCGKPIFRKDSTCDAAWERQTYCSHSCAAKDKIPFCDDPIARCKYILTKTIETEKGCLEWKGSKNQSGYGLIGIQGSLWQTHRAVYHFLVGEIPEGLFICHKCDNPSCINPEHLFVGTRQDNNRDAVNKGRWPGARNLEGNRPWEKKRREESTLNNKLN